MVSLMTYFALLWLFESGGALTELCAASKVNDSCICKTQVTLNSVITMADCASINMESFSDVSQLVKDVNFLDVSRNRIENLENGDRVSRGELETFIISYNRIRNIEAGFFDNLTNLQKLDLSHNNLSVLPILFQNNKNLKILDLSFNNIASIEDGFFTFLTNLRNLDLSYNSPDLGKLLSSTPQFLHDNLNITPSLEHLRMDKIGLGELHIGYFNNLNNLTHLSLADNHLMVVPVVPYSLEYLDLSGSDFVQLQGKNLSYHSLKVLKLKRLHLLNNIHHYAFYNLQALEELYISECRNLKEFNELVFGALNKNTILPLKKLSLARNGLRRLNNTFKFLIQQLDFIDLTNNPWFCDCDLMWFQEIDNFYKGDSIRYASAAVRLCYFSSLLGL